MRISNRFAINLIFFLALIALAFPFAASALDVYKWTDKNGVVHYSEARPPTEAADIGSFETFEIDNEPGPSNASASDYKTMLNVAERLEESRLARERALQAETTSVMPQYGDDDVDYPVFYSHIRGYYRPYYPQYPYAYRPQPYYDYGYSTWPINRGAFVPDIRERADPYNPAARARAEGGEAIRTH